ncbi:HalOD1 output domain-containing protein [Natrinema soli]|uniref:HalOD1 output domain-containing protein n=1 Tax=Natrinema soli TaxID=1930624 RepID=A0ABD5SW73_9EURY|nr:HalOD1 output domain-containing protein [Natrinema soli]
MHSSQSLSATADTSLSMTVIDLVAEADDADPLDLDPLYDVIDPDMLDSLPDADGFSGLEFVYQGYIVSVTDGNDGVEVTLAETGVSVDGSTGDLADTEFST